MSVLIADSFKFFTFSDMHMKVSNTESNLFVIFLS